MKRSVENEEDLTNKKQKVCSDEDGSIDDENTEQKIEKEFRELQNKSQKLIVYTEYGVNINSEEDDGDNFNDDIKNELQREVKENFNSKLLLKNKNIVMEGDCVFKKVVYEGKLKPFWYLKMDYETDENCEFFSKNTFVAPYIDDDYHLTQASSQFVMKHPEQNIWCDVESFVFTNKLKNTHIYSWEGSMTPSLIIKNNNDDITNEEKKRATQYADC